MKVSVIIPFYNEEKYLKNCLESLSRQSFKDFEVIVVDDGSKEKLEIKNKQLKFDNFKFLSQSHQGPGVARNLGAKRAKGEILIFVDSDMTFDKDFLKDLIRPIIKGRVKGTFSREEFVANWDNPWARCWSYNLGVGKRLIPKDYPGEAPVFRAILKKEFNKVGGFSKRGDYTDDWSLSKKLGFKAKAAPGAIYFHYNPESLREIFIQAKWIGKRKRKLGTLGRFFNILRRLMPFSLIFGSFLSLKYKEGRFLLFKIIYDLGDLIGSSETLLGRSQAK